MKTPWHLWTVGVLAVLWNLVGAFDYVMTQTRNEAYMANFTPEQLDYFYGFPTWSVAAWAIAIWGGVLGSILLLLKKGWAVPVFGASLAAMIINSIYAYLLSDGMSMMGTVGAVFSAIIFVISVFLFLYSRRMKAVGLLT